MIAFNFCALIFSLCAAASFVGLPSFVGVPSLTLSGAGILAGASFGFSSKLSRLIGSVTIGDGRFSLTGTLKILETVTMEEGSLLFEGDDVTGLESGSTGSSLIWMGLTIGRGVTKFAAELLALASLCPLMSIVDVPETDDVVEFLRISAVGAICR